MLSVCANLPTLQMAATGLSSKQPVTHTLYGCTVKETNLHSPPHKKQFNTKEDRLEEISGTQQMLPLD